MGLGYVYVGRLSYAVFTLLVLGTFYLGVGWAGIALNPHGFYLVAVMAVICVLFPLVHSAAIAKRVKTAPKKWYSHWGYYVIWIIMLWMLGNTVAAKRGVWFGFETFSLPSESMAPTLQKGDFIMADTRATGRTTPKLGDMVVFRISHQQPTVFYAKRVVGLPGDTIELRNDVLIRNGENIEEDYVRLSQRNSERSQDFGPTVVPKNHFFMMGDNRHNSNDSRFLGTIEQSLIHGIIVHRWFALGQGIRWERFPEQFH